MIYTIQDLLSQNKNYSDIRGKISRDLRDGKIIQIKKDYMKVIKIHRDIILQVIYMVHHIYLLIMFYQKMA